MKTVSSCSPIHRKAAMMSNLKSFLLLIVVSAWIFGITTQSWLLYGSIECGALVGYLAVDFIDEVILKPKKIKE